MRAVRRRLNAQTGALVVLAAPLGSPRPELAHRRPALWPTIPAPGGFPRSLGAMRWPLGPHPLDRRDAEGRSLTRWLGGEPNERVAAGVLELLAAWTEEN